MESTTARLSRMFILFGSGIWLGGFIMLGFGVAPVNFGIAELWQLSGQNPLMPEQSVHYRTIGGELTGTSILRLNVIESACLFIIVLGMVLAWNSRSGSDRNLILRTLLAFSAAVLFYYYAIHVGGRLTEIRTTEPVDFSISDTALMSQVHLEFDRLHRAYTRTASLAMACVFALFTFTIFDNWPASGKEAPGPESRQG